MIQNPLHKVKLKLGIASDDKSKDELILMYLDDSKYTILNIINDTEVPMMLQNVMVDMAVAKVNHQGNEGLKSYSEGGISLSYNDTVSDDVMKQIVKFRKLPK